MSIVFENGMSLKRVLKNRNKQKLKFLNKKNMDYITKQMIYIEKICLKLKINDDSLTELEFNGMKRRIKKILYLLLNRKPHLMENEYNLLYQRLLKIALAIENLNLKNYLLLYNTWYYNYKFRKLKIIQRKNILWIIFFFI